MSTHKCRCGTWTNFGLTCSRCQAEMLDHMVSGESVQEKDPDDTEIIEAPLSELEPEED